MNSCKKRVRMFAGPNGSGKSTIKALIDPVIIGTYVNPDEIEADINRVGYLDLKKYGIEPSNHEVLNFLSHSSFLQSAGFTKEVELLQCYNGILQFHPIRVNAYFASVIADFIRQQLVKEEKSFTFETVMSGVDKIEFLQKAQDQGYKTYLYFVATKDPEINISRVKNRVEIGGHPVPREKIISRYHRSLDLLAQAIKYTHRAYIFDNSYHEHLLIAEITNGNELEMKASEMPVWFKTALLEKFLIEEF